MVDQELLKNPAYFHCERMHGIWMKIRCIEWQKEGRRISCRDCEQGRQIIKEPKMEEVATHKSDTGFENWKAKTYKKCGTRKELETGFAKSAKSKDGYMHICKVCFGGTISKGRLGPEQDLKTSAKEPAPPIEKEPQILSLDLADYPNVIEHLTDEAYINIRTVEQQAIYYIVKGLKLEEKRNAA